MPAGNDHHRKEPTVHRSSDGRSKAAGNIGARPHGSQQAGSSQSGHQSLSEQLLSAAREQQASQQHSPAGHSSPHAMPSQQAPFDQRFETPGTAAGQNASRPNLVLPIALIIAFVVAIGGFGGSCMFNPLGSGGAGTSSWNAAPQGGYTIGSDLGGGNANDTWTVLMYVCGSNLESDSTRSGGGLATSNLLELTQADLGDNVQFIVETGGAKRWQNNVVSARYLERYAIEDGYMVQKQRVPSASMAESSTLEDFLSWGIQNYRADHYMLIFWDHGGGSISGVCNDDLYPFTTKGEADTLTLTEIRDALSSAATTFDVVGFDTCLMATLETAEMLAPYSNYMVASEESEPGTGWDYTAWPTWLAKHPGTSGADLGTVICQTYYNKCANAYAADTVTLSTVDLSKVKAVSEAFRNASDDIAFATVDSSSLRQLYRGAGKSESYGNNGMFSPSMNMVDLADLMSKTRDVIGSDADAVIESVGDAVVFETHGRSRNRASGLSVFYPLQTDDANDFYRYAEITSNTPYLQFLGVMYGVYDKYDWTTYDNYVSLHGEPVAERNIDIAFEQRVKSDGHVQLQVTQGLDKVAEVEIEIYVLLDEIDTLCLVGTDNDLHGSYDTGLFTDNFQDDWLTMDGNYVSASLVEQGDGYNLYYAPIALNGERTGLLVEYDYSTDEFGVICAWDGNDSDTGMAGRTGRLLESGDEVQFLFPATNTETGESDYIALGTMSWHDDPEIAYESLGDGTFAFRYAITDVLGNTQQTDLVYARYENGRYVG